ncbi:YceI family protein [Caulobacter sp.]|jgi:polyisoprenoid-binding protein YceI|uniref:YceI family protein n=1 Tax=Caulobacter sp. TaxID=78 RepID=UPI0016091237
MVRARLLPALAALALLAGPLSTGSAWAAPDRNPASAPTGTYALDTRHAALIARIDHQAGVSKSVFRFDKLEGSLKWDSQKPEQSSLSVTIDPTSINTPVAGFAAELAGDKFFKSSQFPTITFVSKSIALQSPTTGKVTGDLTFLGVTKPVVLDVVFSGVGKAKDGAKLGFAATGKFDRREFGLTYLVGPVGPEVELQIDVEFDQVK